MIGSLLIISYKEQTINTEITQAQTINSLKNAENLQIHTNNPQNNQGAGQQRQVTITNQGAVASDLLYLVVVPVNNNGQIIGPPIQIIPINQVLQPGQSYTYTFNMHNGNYGYGVITAYGNIFWTNVGGGG